MSYDHDSSFGRTSAGLSRPKRLATWNSARDVWETPETEGLFCEHLDVWSETWPSSGTWDLGTAYVLPTWERRTDDSESSSSPSLPTPRATRGGSATETAYLLQGGSQGSRSLPASGHLLPGTAPDGLTLLPTPTSSDANSSGGSNASSVTLTDATVRTRMGTTANERLLPTPEAADGSGGRKSSKFGGFRESGAKRSVTLATAVDHRWGDYAAAIARWEHVIGRPAPEPTETGAKGNPRLSPKFCEWLMGLPAGHVTSEDIGLTRNEMLRALGNGVVPTQSAAATRAFLADMETS